MQLSEHIYAKKIPYRVEVSQTIILNRFVYAYAITGEHPVLIDVDIDNCKSNILSLIEESGLTVQDISKILVSHIHQDYRVVLERLKNRLGCTIAGSVHASPDAAEVLDETLTDGKILDLLGGSSLKVIEVPGHSKDLLAFYHQEDRVLISSDSILRPGQVPVYDDVASSIRSIRKLSNIDNIKVLASTWDDPRKGPDIPQAFSEAEAYIRNIHAAVLQVCGSGGGDALEVAKAVMPIIGISDNEYSPQYLRTIEAHLRAVSSNIMPFGEGVGNEQ